MRRLFLGAAAAAGLGAYALYEPFRFRLVTRTVPVERPGVALSILHISDLHISGGNRALAAFLRDLPERVGRIPDLVVATGDLIQDDSGIEPAVEAMSRLDARLGRLYVLGSHDYFRSKAANYAKYFTGNRNLMKMMRNSVDDLQEGLIAKDWRPVINDTTYVDAPFGRIRIAGVDDPYLGWHDTAHIRTARDDALAIGVVHTPDVVSEWALNGFDLVLAGHTHAGQVRIPGLGAVVTNCSLPSALAGGLHRVGSTWLHVSPGLGSGRFSPIRFNARPEATLLRLESTPSGY